LTVNIERIGLWADNPRQYNGVPIVRVDFKFPCSYTVLNLNDLRAILKAWIQGEELRYPTHEGFQGRWMLFNEIKKVFEED